MEEIIPHLSFLLGEGDVQALASTGKTANLNYSKRNIIVTFNMIWVSKSAKELKKVDNQWG